MSKLVITKWQERLLTALLEGTELLELSLEDDSSILGNIYIGKVNNIVKNLNSAFVDFQEGRTGYYSLTENPSAIYAFSETGQEHRKLRSGDEIVVQVSRDAVKTKDPSLTSNLNFPGKYVVLTAGKAIIGFSSKITDKGWKETLKPKLEAITQGQVGLIVRTNAYRADHEQIIREASHLMAEYQKVLAETPYRTCYSQLYQAQPGYIGSLMSSPEGKLTEVITDQPEVYEKLQKYLAVYQPELLSQIRLYTDSMVSLLKLYSLETALSQVWQKRVWLKSGGYLVIEQTEAMVVIDVNTGKYSGKKSLDETIRKINLEAAQEVCRQLRLRNLSGIIMVDFIDMKAEEDKALLMEQLRDYARIDPVKTTVIDMTALNLVELTRKKGRKPLTDQLRDGAAVPGAAADSAAAVSAAST